MSNQVTSGVWNCAADSYGKVQHSRKACVYTVVKGEGGDRIIKVASQIANWTDAKHIAANPQLYRLVAAVAAASECADHRTQKGQAYLAECLVALGNNAHALMAAIDSNNADALDKYSQRHEMTDTLAEHDFGTGMKVR